MASTNFTTTWAPRLLSVMRIVLAFTFMAHGGSKLLGFPVESPGELNALIAFAGTLELFGGLLLFVGLFTRPVAFILSGMMAVAKWS